MNPDSNVPPQNPQTPNSGYDPAAPLQPVTPPQTPVQNQYAAPTPPQQPTWPAPQSPQPQMQPPAPKKSKLGLVLGLVGGGIALLILIIVGIVVAMSMLTVSKTDYLDASEAVEGARISYSEMNSVLIGSSNSQADIDSNLEKIKKGREGFDRHFAELGSLKAVTRDDEVKKLYEEAKTQKSKFDTSIDAGIESYEKILPAVLSIGDLSTPAAITAFRNKLAAISGLESSVNSDFIAKATDNLDTLAEAARRVEADRADTSRYDATAFSDYLDASTALSDTTREWRDALSKLSDDGQIREEMNALSDLLLQKSAGR